MKEFKNIEMEIPQIEGYHFASCVGVSKSRVTLNYKKIPNIGDVLTRNGEDIVIYSGTDKNGLILFKYGYMVGEPCPLIVNEMPEVGLGYTSEYKKSSDYEKNIILEAINKALGKEE